jgi:ABC-type branched-subunit amino acid transport system ATPase component
VTNVETPCGKSHILHGVCLRVDEGEIVSLLGRNGVGRSTIIKAISWATSGRRAPCASATRRSADGRPT